MKTGNSQAKYCNYSLFTSLCLISPFSCLFDNKSYILKTVAQYEAGKFLVLGYFQSQSEKKIREKILHYLHFFSDSKSVDIMGLF